MNPEVARITRMIEKTFDKSPWYGPCITHVLSEISADQAILRAGQSHSIVELVLHMTSWRGFVTRRLQGEDEFQVSDEANFPMALRWEEAVQKLKQSQVELLAALKEFSDEKLGDLVPNKVQRYTYYTLIHGIIQHDIYHLGQIQLILKSKVPA